MINILSAFNNSLDPVFKSFGIKPKEGLHILLKIQQEGGHLFIDEEAIVQHAFTRDTETTPGQTDFLKRSAALSKMAWCIDTNKCFDLPTKAIHSCSPYCIAIKRENLTGGSKYQANSKSQVYERIDSYFEKATALLDSDEEREKVNIFRQAINSEEKFNRLTSGITVYEKLKDTDYVIIYLDASLDKYQETNNRYLTDKLFNTNDFNVDYQGSIYGTSNYLNGYPTKKMFLTHQTAYFDIAQRISSSEARALYELDDILARNILPNPLPIFDPQSQLKSSIDDIRQSSIALFRREAEDGKRIGFREIMEELYTNHDLNLHSYYLLFYDRGVIKDFDKASSFDYYLRDENDNAWYVKDFFNTRSSYYIDNVFQLQETIIQTIFDNSLVMRTKDGSYRYRYFDEIDPQYCKSAKTYLLVITYRKAFYDYIYKSKREAVTQRMFDTILQTSILEDIRLDKMDNGHHTEERNIREKMNIWFSLSNKFNLSNHKHSHTMATKFYEHQEFIKKLARKETGISSDDQYAYTVGQVIYYLLYQSKSADTSHKMLSPFLQQHYAANLNKAISLLFSKYAHETPSNNFKHPFAQLMEYQTNTSINDLLPYILAGYFSHNELFADRPAKESLSETVEIENNHSEN
ncbi:hypothetical protein [Chitinophaga qingshengii]|uniref:CRISPR-associated protein Csh1 n=1 Tax=Chitinophaga qingshengii TaxID=1569794 RepID=A0ABR7TK22_9BACT|nr:hypothetical protein [Chitinophaga qingshengii]MBC9929878.1 hypothetical protein [Chitinophaga qingshengii]